MWVYNFLNIKLRVVWTLLLVVVRVWILSVLFVIFIFLSCCNCDWKYFKNGYYLFLLIDRLISSLYMCEIVLVIFIKIIMI